MEQKQAAPLKLIETVNKFGGKCTLERVQAGCHLLRAEHSVPRGYLFVMFGYRPYSEARDEEVAALRRLGWMQSSAERNGHRVPVTRYTATRPIAKRIEDWEESVNRVAEKIAGLAPLDALLTSAIESVRARARTPVRLTLSIPSLTRRPGSTESD